MASSSSSSSKLFVVNDKAFHKNSQKGNTIYLNCANKKLLKCPATAKVVDNVVSAGKVHNDACIGRVPVEYVDFTERARDQAIELATTSWADPNEIWKIINNRNISESSNFRSLRKDQIVSLIYNHRRKAFDGSTINSLCIAKFANKLF